MTVLNIVYIIDIEHDVLHILRIYIYDYMYLKQASACGHRPGHFPRGGKLES